MEFHGVDVGTQFKRMRELVPEAYRAFLEFDQKAFKDGAAERLRPDSDGARVRVKAGHAQVMDGPFAETKEAIGGFYLIDCDTKAEAVEWAKKVPLGDGGFVEVRPIWPM